MPAPPPDPAEPPLLAHPSGVVLRMPPPRAAPARKTGRTGEAAVQAKAGLVALRQRSLSPVESPFAREALEDLRRRAGG